MSKDARTISLLDSVLLHIGLASDDTRLESVVTRFLVPVVATLSSDSPQVRKKAMEVCNAFLKRLKSATGVIGPVNELLKLLVETDGAFVRNFALVFVELLYPLQANNAKRDMLPSLLLGGIRHSGRIMESLLRLSLPVLSQASLSIPGNDWNNAEIVNFREWLLNSLLSSETEAVHRVSITKFVVDRLEKWNGAVLPHIAVAACDPSNAVSSLARPVLRLIDPCEDSDTISTWYKCLDMTMPVQAKVMILNALIKSKAAASHAHAVQHALACIKSNDTALIRVGFGLAGWVLESGSDEAVDNAGPSLLAAINAHLANIGRERGYAYVALSLAANRLPHLFIDSHTLSMLLSAMDTESIDVKPGVQAAVWAVCGAMRSAQLSASVQVDVEQLLLREVMTGQKLDAISAARRIFPFSNVTARIISIVGMGAMDESVRQEGRRGLGWSDFNGSVETVDVYPDFSEYVRRIISLSLSERSKAAALLFGKQISTGVLLPEWLSFIEGCVGSPITARHALSALEDMAASDEAKKLLLSKIDWIIGLVADGSEVAARVLGLLSDHLDVDMVSAMIKNAVVGVDKGDKGSIFVCGYVGCRTIEALPTTVIDALVRQLVGDNLPAACKAIELLIGAGMSVDEHVLDAVVAVLCDDHSVVEACVPLIGLLGKTQSKAVDVLVQHGIKAGSDLVIQYAIGRALSNEVDQGVIIDTMTAHPLPALVWAIFLVRSGRAELLPMQNAVMPLLGDGDRLITDILGRLMHHIGQHANDAVRDALYKFLFVDQASSVKYAPYRELMAISSAAKHTMLIYDLIDHAGSASLDLPRDTVTIPEPRLWVPLMCRSCHDPRDATKKVVRAVFKAMGGHDHIEALWTEIRTVIVDGLANKSARSRECSCTALANMFPGRSWSEIGPVIDVVWHRLLRVRDDMHDSVRVEAQKALDCMLVLAARFCTERSAIEAHFPVLLDECIQNSAADSRSVALKGLLVVVSAAKDGIKPYAHTLVTTLVESLSLEGGDTSALLNYLQLHAGPDEAQMLSQLHSSLSSASPLNDAVDIGVANVDAAEVGSLAYALVRLVRHGVGLPTCSGAARTLNSLIVKHPVPLRQHASKILRMIGDVLAQATVPRTIRMQVSKALVSIAAIAADNKDDDVVVTVLSELQALYNDGDIDARMVVANMFQLLSKATSASLASCIDGKLFAVVFVGKYDPDPKTREGMRDAWESICNGIVTVRLHLADMIEGCKLGLDSSVWARQEQGATALHEVLQMMASSDPSVVKPHLIALHAMLIPLMKGRVWPGKGQVVKAAAALVILLLRDTSMESLMMETVTLLVHECARGKKAARLANVEVLGSLLESAMAVSIRIYDAVCDTLTGSVFTKDIEGDTEALKKLSETHRVAALHTLAVSWRNGDDADPLMKIMSDNLADALPWRVREAACAGAGIVLPYAPRDDVMLLIAKCMDADTPQLRSSAKRVLSKLDPAYTRL